MDINYKKETFSIKIKDNFDKVNSLFQNLGYFIERYKVYRKDRFNIFKWENFPKLRKDMRNYTSIELYYSARFDKELVVDSYLYRATKIKNLEKISNVGLYLNSLSKKGYHPSRIYFSIDFDSCEKITPELRATDYPADDYIILKINPNFYVENYNKTKYKVKYFKDPNYNNGIYTYSNIPKEKITYLNKIYSENIIEWNSYQIVKKQEIIFYKNDDIVYHIKRGKRID